MSEKHSVVATLDGCESTASVTDKRPLVPRIGLEADLTSGDDSSNCVIGALNAGEPLWRVEENLDLLENQEAHRRVQKPRASLWRVILQPISARKDRSKEPTAS